MAVKYNLDTADYLVISVTLLASVGIGIATKVCGGQNATTNDYLLAGKKMPIYPVIFSIVVTLTSPGAMLATPAEIYKYGLKFIFSYLLMPFGMYLASVVFLPVYFRCGVATTYQFLVMRYGPCTRNIISAISILQMIFYMSTSLYGAVLALSAVTDLSMERSIIALGAICAIYCTIGGLKAVLWADVFQALLMIMCLLSIYIAAVGDIGIFKIYEPAKEGHRLDMFDIQFDFTRRYGLWACVIRGLIKGFGAYGSNQLEVQRLLSLSSLKRAQSTLRISSIPATLMYLICAFFGVVLHSIYYLCDPVLNKEQSGIKKYDQLVPAYIVRRFNGIPGMTGLCIAGIFSASLSTISSALNSASTVTVIDFIKPLSKNKPLSDVKIVWLARLFTLIYGGVCIGLSFSFLNVSSLKHLMYVIVSLFEGPVLAIFLVGVLTRKACDKCASFAMLMTYIIMASLAFGSLISNYSQPTLPLSTSGCSLPHNITSIAPCMSIGNCTNTRTLTSIPKKEIFILYKISFMWFSAFGFLLALMFISFAILLTGWRRNVIPEDSVCLSPVIGLWKKTTKPIAKDNFDNEYALNECN